MDKGVFSFLDVVARHPWNGPIAGGRAGRNAHATVHVGPVSASTVPVSGVEASTLPLSRSPSQSAFALVSSHCVTARESVRLRAVPTAFARRGR